MSVIRRTNTDKILELVHSKPLKLIYSDKWPDGALCTLEAYEAHTRPIWKRGVVTVVDVDPGLAGALQEACPEIKGPYVEADFL